MHGCGGVGLSAIMISAALGAHVIAIDIESTHLEMAARLGAEKVVNARTPGDVAASVRELSGGGVHLSLDALGSAETCRNSVMSLRKRGRHVQVGLMTGNDSAAPIPWSELIGRELEIIGSHGLQASAYEEILEMIIAGSLDPGRLVSRSITLDAAAGELRRMGTFAGTGVTVIDSFSGGS